MLIAYVVVFNLPFFIEDFMLHVNKQLWIIETFILFQESVQTRNEEMPGQYMCCYWEL